MVFSFVFAAVQLRPFGDQGFGGRQEQVPGRDVHRRDANFHGLSQVHALAGPLTHDRLRPLVRTVPSFQIWPADEEAECQQDQARVAPCRNQAEPGVKWPPGEYAAVAQQWEQSLDDPAGHVSDHDQPVHLPGVHPHDGL